VSATYVIDKMYVVTCVLRDSESDGARDRQKDGQTDRERMKAALLEGERERERAYAYVVSRSPQTHTLVPGFALHENTCS
jgi:hypothetical protein